MTVVAGLIEGGRAYLGADSAAVGGWDLDVRTDSKVFRLPGPMLLGFTTSFRMGQILRYHVTPPARGEGVDEATYLTRDFIEVVRTVLKEKGFARVNDNVHTGGEFLIAYGGGLFLVDSDYQVGTMAAPFAAVGCGAAYAKGALAATEASSMPPRRRLLLALRTAERFSAGVRRPFRVLSMSCGD